MDPRVPVRAGGGRRVVGAAALGRAGVGLQLQTKIRVLRAG